MLIDDFARRDLVSSLGTRWRGVSDEVMGGIAQASVVRDSVDARPCLRLSGDVRLENNGGFIQAALDLADPGKVLDASSYTGLRIEVLGNGETYAAHLRTPDNVRSWQSYRSQFTADAGWRIVELPFNQFKPHRLEIPLDHSRLLRIGLVAIGRAFSADLSICRIELYR